MYSLCVSCHKLPAYKKIGFRVMCKSCIVARETALKKHKAKIKVETKVQDTDWDEKRLDIIGSNGNDGLHY